MSTDLTPSRRSEIRIAVELNAQKQPVALAWHAEDAGLESEKPARSLMFSAWDPAEKSTMRIDLWTHEMTVEEMDFFFYETLAGMADTYERSTADASMADRIRQFAREFGREKKVIR
jgi:gliding motility-associated protein GldC